MQIGQLISFFHTFTDLVNRVGVLQNTDWLVSNVILSPTYLTTTMCFFLSSCANSYIDGNATDNMLTTSKFCVAVAKYEWALMKNRAITVFYSSTKPTKQDKK